MDNDDKKFSSNSSQPSSSTANLPETRTGEGKTISSRSLLIVISTAIFLVTLLVGGVYLGLAYRKPTPKMDVARLTSPSTPTPAVELPPLYLGFKWQYTEKKVKGSSYTRKGDTIELDMYRADSETLAAYPTEFVTYYKQELTTREWIETAMAGSGVSGDFYFYEKNGHYINFGVFVARDNSGRVLNEYWAFVEHN